MHLTFALIVCDFLAIVSADPANDHLIWRKSYRKRQISSVNSTNAVNSTHAQGEQASDSAAPSVSSSQSILTSALLPSLSRPSSSSSTPPSPPLGTAPLRPENILPSVFLAGNTTSPGSTTELTPVAPLGTGKASIQTAPNSNSTLNLGASVQPNSYNNVQPPSGTGGFYPTAGSSDVLSAVDTGALFANSTTTSESSLTTARIPLITGTGTGSYPTLAAGGWNSTGNSTVKNSTCGGCVVNAQAGLDWWYTMNIYQAIASVSTIRSNGSTLYSLAPAQTTINVTDALWANGATFLYTETFDETQNSTVGDYIYTTLPPPAAATTSITTISDVLPPPNGTFGADVLDALNTDPGVPTFAVPGATGTLNIVSQPTNAVYYTAYEVELAQASTDDQGHVVCATTTATYQLADPSVYEFDGTDLGASATETGDLNPDFMAMIPQSSCSPGIFVASSPVMIIVVEVTYQRGFSVFLVHHEVSDAGTLDAPTSTTDDDAGAAAATGGGANVVSVRPVVLSADNTVITISQAVTGNPASVAVSVGTRVVTGSVVGGGTTPAAGSTPATTAGSGSGGGIGGGIASAIVSILGGGNTPTTGSSGGGILSNIANALGVGNAASTANVGASPNAGTSAIGGVGFATVPTANSGSGSGSSAAGSVSNPGPASGSNSAASGSNSGISGSNSGSSGSNSGSSGSNSGSSGSNSGSSGSNSGGSGSNSGSSGSNSAGSGSSPGGSANGGSSGGDSAANAVPVLTVGGQTFVGNAATQFLVAPGQTLTPGGIATVGSNTVSLAAGATALVVNGVTSQIAVPVATPLPALNIGGQVVTANAGGSFIIQGQTLTQGGQITVGSNTVSLAQGASTLVVNGQTITRAATLPTASPILAIDGTTFAAASEGQSFIIGGKTLTPGGVIVANGNTISLGTGASSTIAVVNGVTQSLGNIMTPAALTLGSSTFTVLPGGSFVISRQTLRPGSTAITVSGTTLSLGAGASVVVVNGKTSTLSIGSIPAIVIGGMTYAATSALSGAYIIGGQTLTPGGVVTVNGHTISLAAGATALVIDGSTSVLKQPAAATNPPLLTVGDKTYTANSGTTFVIGGKTLTPGGIITVDGHTISLASGATAVVVDGKTTTLFPATNPPLLTVGDKTYTANSGTTFIIDGMTLTPGGIITVDGHTISLASGATAVVIDGKTTTLFPATKTPNAVSAIATGSTSTTKNSNANSSGSSGATGIAATTSKKGAASPSTQVNIIFTFASTLVAFLGILGTWI